VTAYESIVAKVDKVAAEWTGPFLTAEIEAHVRLLLDDDERVYATAKGLHGIAAARLRAKEDDTGLPKYPEIDASGYRAHQDMLDFGQWRYVCASYMRRSRQNKELAGKARSRAWEATGQWIDLDTVEDDVFGDEGVA
jgi:hypothetical protein